MRVKKPKGLTLEQWIERLEAEKEDRINKAVAKYKRSLVASLDARIEYLKRFGIRESSTLKERAEALFEYRKIYCTLMGMTEDDAEQAARLHSERWLNSMRQ